VRPRPFLTVQNNNRPPAGVSHVIRNTGLILTGTHTGVSAGIPRTTRQNPGTDPIRTYQILRFKRIWAPTRPEPINLCARQKYSGTYAGKTPIFELPYITTENVCSVSPQGYYHKFTLYLCRPRPEPFPPACTGRPRHQGTSTHRSSHHIFRTGNTTPDHKSQFRSGSHLT